jgi:hypothetical protein
LQEGSCIGLLFVYDGRHTQNDFIFYGIEHAHAVFAFTPCSIEVVFELRIRPNGCQGTQVQHTFEFFVRHRMHPVAAFYTRSTFLLKWHHPDIGGQLFATGFRDEVIGAADDV